MTARCSGKCPLWPGLAVAVRDARPTEREGFEPSMDRKAHNGVRVRSLQRSALSVVRRHGPRCATYPGRAPSFITRAHARDGTPQKSRKFDITPGPAPRPVRRENPANQRNSSGVTAWIATQEVVGSNVAHGPLTSDSAEGGARAA